MGNRRSGRARSVYLQDDLWDQLDDFVDSRVQRGERLPDGRTISVSPTVAEAVAFFLAAKKREADDKARKPSKP